MYKINVNIHEFNSTPPVIKFLNYGEFFFIHWQNGVFYSNVCIIFGLLLSAHYIYAEISQKPSQHFSEQSRSDVQIQNAFIATKLLNVRTQSEKHAHMKPNRLNIISTQLLERDDIRFDVHMYCGNSLSEKYAQNENFRTK